MDLRTAIFHLGRIHDGYVRDPKLLKEIATVLGAKTSGTKAKVIQACYDKIKERRQQTINASWRKNTGNGSPEIIATTDKKLVKSILSNSNVAIGLCERYRWNENEVEQVGVPAVYAYDVMFATNRNESNRPGSRIQRRVYFIMRRGEDVIGIAETRFADDAVHLTLMCGLGGTGNRLMRAVERVAKTMGFGKIELNSSTNETASMWKSKHNFKGNGRRLAKEIKNNRNRVVGVPKQWTNTNWTVRVS
jgi:hypothetical protein